MCPPEDTMTIDDHQDIARSSYADMLHDDERNVAYYQAIMASVHHLVHSSELNPTGDRFFNCCDIGTGSGLLSMMIVKTFRDLNYKHFHVTSFEAFKPMAECAKRIVALNNMSSDITVIPTRSEEYTENPQFDLLVAELLDTELIGEGCLITYRHAVENLCSPNCIFIPESAHIYIQPLNSKYHYSRQRIQDQKLCWGLLGTIEVVDEEAKSCCGLSEIDDLHLNDNCRLASDELAEPKKVFDFKFSDLTSLKLRDSAEVKFEIKNDQNQQYHPVIVMWWDIVMYPKAWYAKYIKPEGVHSLPFDVLSCAPEWLWTPKYQERNELIRAHYNRDIWREHWLRGIYHLPNIKLLTGDENTTIMNVYAYHDSHSLWFDLKPCESKLPPSCSCTVHRFMSRSEIAFINDTDMMSKLTLGLFKITPVTRSDAVKKQVCEKVKLIFNYAPEYLEPKWKIEFHYSYNYLHHKKVIDLSLQDDVCWLGLMRRLLKRLSIEPFVNFTIKCSQVFFDDLNRIRMNVGTCEGFNLEPLDELISRSSGVIDSSVESRHLYEYRCKNRIKDSYDNRMKEITIFSTNDTTVAMEGLIEAGDWTKRIKIEAPTSDYKYLRNHWALIFWADLELANGRVIDTGFWSLGGSLRFSPHFKQLVHFLHDHPVLANDDGSCPVLELDIGLSLEGLTVKRV
uniref:Protein arginine N-methyltransferase 7 n=1 Tax=Aceria tosichella TaxID=561515 RepID=A0A6G1SBX6_9ACAR